GFTSTEEHLIWIQGSQAGHHQPAWRVRDRAPASSLPLAPEKPEEWDRLPDVNFRIDKERGRVVWSVDGEDYTKQFYPPNLRNLEFTPHSLIAEMDYAGVDMALIHTNPMLGRDSAFLAECVQLYPDRLRAMAPVDEWRIAEEPDAVIEELSSAMTAHHLHAIKFNASLAYFGAAESWDDGPYRSFWETATSFGVPIFFTLGSGRRELRGGLSEDTEQQGYLGEQKVLMRWMERYPDSVCNLTHGFPWRAFIDGDGLTLPDEIWAPFENPNCNLEICFPVRLGDLFEYPFRQVWPTLEAMLENVSAEHLNWGTDMPFQNRFCTYRQSRTWIESHCTFLSAQDREQIFGGTIARIFGLDVT
ncbi:MAG: amidohydrolase family protein, partial [Planctomycetota bacterium]|nr:amidohydrolase family protein [Planctomycetota bacterium]